MHATAAVTRMTEMRINYLIKITHQLFNCQPLLQTITAILITITIAVVFVGKVSEGTRLSGHSTSAQNKPFSATPRNLVTET